MAVLPMHSDDRGGSRLLTRPRTLAFAFVVFFLFFFWMFLSGGPLVPAPGPYKPGNSHDSAHAPPPGGWDNNKPPPPPPNELDGHGHSHGHAGDNHNPPPPPANGHPINYAENDAAADTEHAWPVYEEGEGGKWSERAGKVKGAFKHAWGAYERKAWGKDELKPMSGQAINNFNGWGVTIIDSLDTLVLMGLKEEFNKALEHVANVNVTATSQSIHFFETVIRYLGGYLSAYHLTSPPEPILLTQASALGNVLLRVFDTPSGLPGYSAPTQPHEGDKYSSGRVSMYFAEVGSCQVEFKYLAHLTGDARYWKAADKVTRLMKDEQPKTAIPGLFGTNWDINSGKPSQNQFTIGALSDSAYEYLLKQYLLSGRTEKYLLDMYIAATDAMIENTLYLSPTRNLLYVTDVNTWTPGQIAPSGKLEHLSCFLPGLFALGADQLNDDELDEKRRKRHRWAAEGLAYTCYAMYAENRHGLGPEDVQFKSNESKNWGKVLKDWEASSESKASGAKPPGVAKLAPLEKDPKKDRDYPSNSPDYFLRPESIESVYLLWKTTKDEIWRERGWTMWEAVDKETRVENGFANAANLNGDRIMHSDQMPSYFFAETLKYYYLLFSNADPWPLNKYVFNTEAHPLPVYHLREWERRKFGVDGS